MEINESSREGPSIRDLWLYSPSREQWESDDWYSQGSFRLNEFFALFGIHSARWGRLTLENKRGAKNGD